MPLEKSITNKILSYLNSLPECIAEKVEGNAKASGRADINACYKGHTLRIEVKTPDNRNKASETQNHNLVKWNRAGAFCMVVYTLDAVKYFIEYIDKIDSIGIPEDTFGVISVEKQGCFSKLSLPAIR